MITPPELLTEAHDTHLFQSGEVSLDDWLRRRALANQKSGVSRTYAITDGARVIGYYALAVGALIAGGATGRVRRNMPDPVPVMILGRLAVDQAWQGKGLGLDLLANAVFRTLQVAEIAGVRALLAHALNEGAAGFYEKAGFVPSPFRPFTYMILIEDAQSLLGNI